MDDASVIGGRYAAVRCSLNERGRRLFAAAEARAAGHGGISVAARATGVARSTIGRGLKDLDHPGALSGTVRRPGSGRHSLTATDPTLLDDLCRLLEPATDGTSDRQEQHPQAARPAEIPPAGEPKVVQVCHFPPGTSKWNKVEHRLFCHITENWRGKPLTSRMVVVELIAATTTTTGLTVRCELDPRSYPKGIKVTDQEMASLNITTDAFHPEWNYTIAPRSPT